MESNILTKVPTEATRLVRKMRGGAQAHLLEAADGHAYVVKFTNNPQHRRILINEWISSKILAHLGILTPPASLIHVSRRFLERNSEACIRLGSQRSAIPEGLHFGSRFPGHAGTTTVFDLIPDPLLSRVKNRADFVGVFAFDKWIGNTDARQAVFYRDEASPTGNKRPLLGSMVDGGFAFDGPNWRFGDSPIAGLYRPVVYRSVTGLDSFNPWLQRIQGFPENILADILDSVPEEWLWSNSIGDPVDEKSKLAHLLNELLRRRQRVAELIEATRDTRIDPFFAWRRNVPVAARMGPAMEGGYTNVVRHGWMTA